MNMHNYLQDSPCGCKKIGDEYIPSLKGVLIKGNKTTQVSVLFDDGENITSDHHQAMETAEKLHKLYGEQLIITIY